MKLAPGKLSVFVAFGLITIIFFSFFASAETLIVSKEQTNFDSIQEAIEAAVSGDSILIKDGIYKGNLTLNKDLTLKGDSGADVNITGSSKGKPVLIIGPSGIDVSLSNLTLRGARGELCDDRAGGICPSGISVTGESRVTLTRVSVVDNGRDGLRIDGSSRVVLNNSRVEGNKRYGIWLSDSSSASVQNSRVVGNRNGVTVAKHAEVDIVKSKIGSSRGYGVSLFGQSKVELNSTKIVDNGGGGIQVENSARVDLIDNFLTGNKGEGVLIEGLAAVTMKNNSVRGNQIGITNHSSGSTEFGSNEITENTIDLIGDIRGNSRSYLRKERANRITLPSEDYPTIQAAVDALLPGGTILLKGDVKGGAVIDKEMTLESNDNDAQIFMTGETVVPVLSLINGADLTVTGLELTGSGGSGIVLGGNAELRIVSSSVSQNGEEGIGLWDASRLDLLNSEISGNDGSGIRLVDASGLAARDSLVIDNELYGVLLAGSATGNIKKTKVAGNGSQGILLSGKARLTSKGATISGNSQDGIKLTGNSRSKLENCEISGNEADGIALFSSARNYVHESKIFDNVTGISLRNRSLLAASNNLIEENETGIKVIKPGSFVGRVKGEGNELAHNDSNFSGLTDATKQHLIE